MTYTSEISWTSEMCWTAKLASALHILLSEVQYFLIGLLHIHPTFLHVGLLYPILMKARYRQADFHSTESLLMIDDCTCKSSQA